VSAETLAVLRHPGVLAVFGALIGSFLNVVIHRVPLRISLSTPPSRCPKCKKPVAPWDNIPIVSWLILRGKCRHCRKVISIRYPLVEAATAGLFALAGATVSNPIALAFTLAFLAAMVVVTFIDLDHMIIPDLITLPGTAIGLAAAFIGAAVEPRQALIGILVGAGGLLAVAMGYRAATGRDGLGGGDVKLLGMVGAFLGPAGAFLTIMIGSFAGTLYACLFLLRAGEGRTAELPFGTFLAPGAVIVLFWGPRIVEVYWGLFS
jgi:leader peptidase (prepilin peptidase)/N-methyltransferase